MADIQDSLVDTSLRQNDCPFDGEIDLESLVDTEINLGKGHQGVVRLMILNNGKNQYVAVKVLNLDDKDRYGNSFEEEALVWKELDKMSYNSQQLVPKLFGIKIMTTTDKKNFGIIVSTKNKTVIMLVLGPDLNLFLDKFTKHSNHQSSSVLPLPD